MSRPLRIVAMVCFALICTTLSAADPLTIVTDVELQPLAAGVKRVAQALEFAGAPLSAQQQAALDKAIANTD